MSDATRIEHDLLGDKETPNDCYYGVQTQRAVENFKITDIPLSHFPQFVNALALVKKAAARTNSKLQHLDPEIATAICQACDRIATGELHDQFVRGSLLGTR